MMDSTIALMHAHKSNSTCYNSLTIARIAFVFGRLCNQFVKTEHDENADSFCLQKDCLN